ncbi:MAG: hypothetical protein FWG77_01940 [Treponema sp.]|nr:hypothetical protein [Treponema sp.]
MKRAIICFLLFACLLTPVFSRVIAMPQLSLPTAASNGFGGTHVSFTDNVYSLLVNPAAMVRVRQRSFFSLSPSIMNPQFIVDSTRYARELFTAAATVNLDTFGEVLGNIGNDLGNREGKLALGLDLREFPLSFAWVTNGFGFGIWNRTFINANIEGVYLEGIWVSANIFTDLIVPVGFAFRVLDNGNHSIDTGITLKPYFRGMIFEQERVSVLTGEENNFAERINIPLMTGFGFDLGLLYRIDPGFSVGATFTDIVNRAYVIRNLNPNIIENNTYYVPFTMNLGLAYDFRLGHVLDDAPFLLNSLGFTFAFDWRNIVNVFMQYPLQQGNYLDRNAALDIGVGFQISWLDIIFVRIGMSDMLPAAGLGISLGPVEIDMAYYGKEFGREPGLLPTAMVDFSIAVRPLTAVRNWPWARRALFNRRGE